MARRKRRKKAKANDGAMLAAGGGFLLAAAAAWHAVRAHPVAAALIAAVVLAVGAGWAYLRWRATNRLMAYERDVAVTDHMSGTDFEQFVARLLRDSACSRVQVCGGAGDMGADIIARTPDGHRLVVQCKRYTGNLSSPDVQKFAGTARDIHRADVAMIVTTGRPTGPALQVARQCRITVVDRPALARWISTGASPFGPASVQVSDRGRP